jgi:hypothetical protein
MAALEKYVDFGQLRAGEGEAMASPKPRAGSLHKGMLLQEVDALLGAPTTATERKEGSLKALAQAGQGLDERGKLEGSIALSEPAPSPRV